MTTLWDNIKKGFMDSAKIAKEGAHIAAEKAEELGKKSKVMLDISNIKRKIEKQFTELGGIAYHAIVEENVTDFSSYEKVTGHLETIKTFEAELNEKQEELERIGRMKDDAEPEVKEETE